MKRLRLKYEKYNLILFKTRQWTKKNIATITKKTLKFVLYSFQRQFMYERKWKPYYKTIIKSRSDET